MYIKNKRDKFTVTILKIKYFNSIYPLIIAFGFLVQQEKKCP